MHVRDYVVHKLIDVFFFLLAYNLRGIILTRVFSHMI